MNSRCHLAISNEETENVNESEQSQGVIIENTKQKCCYLGAAVDICIIVLFMELTVIP